MAKLANATIPVEEATVQERQITARVLTIGTKQVTQALYKQLVEKDIIDNETGKLKGPVWGWVNLHDGCKEGRTHLHAIWEDNGQLKRCVAYPSHKNSYRWCELEESIRDLTEAYLGRLCLEDVEVTNQATSKTFSITVKDRTIRIDTPQLIKDFWGMREAVHADLSKVQEMQDSDFPCYCSGNYYHRFRTNSGGNFQTRQEAVDHIASLLLPDEIEKWKKLIEKDIVDKKLAEFEKDRLTSYRQFRPEIGEYVEAMRNIESEWMGSYRTIQDAGQLFIAVSGVWK